ncbi:hypothetical protein ACLRDC_09080 [Gluconacetobacter sacchari]
MRGAGLSTACMQFVTDFCRYVADKQHGDAPILPDSSLVPKRIAEIQKFD